MEKRYAVVTGSAGGIGSECVRMLLAQGWHVFGLDVRAGEPLPSAAEGTENLTTLHCDVADAASVEKAFAAIADRTKALNALVCCTGILRVGPLDKMPTDAFDAIFAVNVRGPWLCAKAAVPLLEAASRLEYPSRMIFLSSVAAFRPKLNGGAYSATKAALETITRAFAGELAPKGILVNAVAPGPVDTPFVQQASADTLASGSYKPGGKSPIPLGRMASARDVVNLMKFLLSNDSNNLVGSIVASDGGVSAVRM